jgi:serine/threonine protein kinase
VPNELEAQAGLAGVDPVAQLRQDHLRYPALIDHTNRTYRVYSVWQPHGDLETFLDGYNNRNEDVPEPFIWCVAERLILAGQFMLQGAATGPRTDNTEIVHRDIKLRNVFLGERDVGGYYPDYPRACLGDFGTAVFTSPTDPNNPDWYRIEITERWVAPEQLKWFDATNFDETDVHRIGEATNVYSLGLIIYTLVMRNVDPPEPTWLGDAEQDDTFDIPATRPYSERLKELIDHCLAFDPSARPNFDWLMQFVQVSVSENVGGMRLANGMRTGVSLPAQRAQNLVNYVPDRYGLQFMRDAGVLPPASP